MNYPCIVRVVTAIASLLGMSAWSMAQTNQLATLNQLDARNQQRQQQHQNAQSLQLAPRSEGKLDELNFQTLTLPFRESTCYPIHRIDLVDYGNELVEGKVDERVSTATSSSVSAFPKHSRFSWALDKAVRQLDLHLPHCLGTEGVSILMKQIQHHIIAKGYVTTRVLAQEQDLQSGSLVLTVIVGKVGQIRVLDNSAMPRFSRLQQWTGLSFSSGDVLNVRDIEQSLENLKRIPSADAQIDMVSSPHPEAVGVSDILVSYRQTAPYRFTLGLDDAGSTATGKYQINGAFAFDNLLTGNDLFYASATHRLKSKEDDRGYRASKQYTLYYSIPFGYWNLSASKSFTRYAQSVWGAFGKTYLYSGKSHHSKITLSYLLYRDNARKTTLSGSFWTRRSQNFIDGTEIEVQKRRMAGWELGLLHKEYMGQATVDFSIHYKRGTGARGSLAAPEELWGEGTSRPRIVTASLAWLQPFQLWNQSFVWDTSVSGQWSKTPLIMQDRFSIGGRYTVRGFDGELTLTGDRGWLWRNTLGWNLAHSGQQLYVGVDAGRVMGKSTEWQLGERLVGGVIGMKGSWKGVHYDLFVGKPLYKPTGFRTAKTTAGFYVSYSF